MGAAEVVDRLAPHEGPRPLWRHPHRLSALMRFKRTFTDPFPQAREGGFTAAWIATFHGTARASPIERRCRWAMIFSRPGTWWWRREPGPATWASAARST